jgi:hypothetical protein
MRTTIKNTKVYLSPLSQEIVQSCRDLPVGFIISRRQVDHNGGYVNNWTTSTFAKDIKGSANVPICRDHGGPGQGQDDDDGTTSFSYDVQFLDLIHIDPWLRFKQFDEAVNETIRLLEYCSNQNSACFYEIGTEESIRAIDASQLDDMLHQVKNRLPSVWPNVIYAVIQSGTRLCEAINTGKYNRDRLKDMISVCRKYGLLSKEHNGDFLSGDVIAEKFALGLDAINLAPEFGCIQTNAILSAVGQTTIDRMFDECYRSGKWKKWVSPGFDPIQEKNKTIEISGHYLFSTPIFQELIAKARPRILQNLQLRLSEVITAANRYEMPTEWKTG